MSHQLIQGEIVFFLSVRNEKNLVLFEDLAIQARQYRLPKMNIH